jgi:hypothetical protein
VQRHEVPMLMTMTTTTTQQVPADRQQESS